MCNIINISRRRVGYKLLFMKSGKFYSSFTGQQIEVGKVPKPPLKAVRLSSYWSERLDDFELIHCHFYNKKLAGKTSAFVNLNNAYIFFNNFNSPSYIRYDSGMIPVLVKIKFRGNVYKGYYNDFEIIASDYINKIERIT